MSTSALLTLIRPWLAARPIPTITAAMITTARQHRLGGWLHHLGAPLPQALAPLCQTDWTQNIAGHLHRLHQLEQIWPNIPPPILFKGADLAEHLYRDLGARRSQDLDLLIESAYAPTAHRALAAAATTIHPSKHERRRSESPHATGYQIGGILIELHTAPQPHHRSSISMPALCSRARPCRLDSISVRTPSPLDRALLWLANRTKDAFGGDLTDALDGALILRALTKAEENRWPQLAAQAGLSVARELAEYQLSELGLWRPKIPRPALISLIPPARSSRAAMPSWPRRQLIKLSLAAAPARRAMLYRALTL